MPRRSGRRPLPAGVPVLLTAYACTTLGLAVQVTALGKQVYDITGRTLDLGWLGLAEFLPTALLAPLTGTLADRYDRRRVMALGLLGEAVCSLGIAAYVATSPTSVVPIFAIVVAFGIARAFMIPAVRALPADLSDAESLPRVVPLTSVAWQAASVIGPVVAGFSYAARSWLPFVIAGAGSAAAAAIALAIPGTGRRVSGQAPTGREVVHEAREGLRFIRRRPVLLGAISLDLFAVLFGGAVALLPAVADERLGVGAVGLGWLRAAGGIGAGLTTLVLAARPVTRRVGPVLFSAVAVFGFATIALGLTRTYSVAFLAMFVLSAADSVSVFIRATLVPLVTPAEMRGRVLAVENVFIGGSNELGAFESGVAAQLLGTVGAIVLGGVGTLAVVGIWWTAFPALRTVDRFPTGTEPMPATTPAPAAPPVPP